MNKNHACYFVPHDEYLQAVGDRGGKSGVIWIL
jgi:hypothetical protein